MSQKKRIVWGDSDIGYAEMRASLLASDFEIEFCRNADELLAFLNDENKVPDLIVVDVVLPPGDRLCHYDTDEGLMTGLFVALEIRKFSQFRGMPIVALCMDLPTKVAFLELKDEKICILDFTVRVHELTSTIKKILE